MRKYWQEAIQAWETTTQFVRIVVEESKNLCQQKLKRGFQFVPCFLQQILPLPNKIIGFTRFLRISIFYVAISVSIFHGLLQYQVENLLWTHFAVEVAEKSSHFSLLEREKVKENLIFYENLPR